MCFLELREVSDLFRFLFLRFLLSEEEEEEGDSSDEELQEEEEVDLFFFFFNLKVLINHEVMPLALKMQYLLANLSYLAAELHTFYGLKISW